MEHYAKFISAQRQLEEAEEWLKNYKDRKADFRCEIHVTISPANTVRGTEAPWHVNETFEQVVIEMRESLISRVFEKIRQRADNALIESEKELTQTLGRIRKLKSDAKN